jgi:hypothetical protein
MQTVFVDHGVKLKSEWSTAGFRLNNNFVQVMLGAYFRSRNLPSVVRCRLIQPVAGL